MKNQKNYYNKIMPNPNLGIDLFICENFNNGKKFNTHWHENMQIYFFTQGNAIVTCNKNQYYVKENSIIIINNNDLHSLESLTNNLKFYTIRINSDFLFSNQIDICQTKFFSPLSQNQISFKHLIEGDINVLTCINQIINEYFSAEIGHELAVKSSIYNLIVILLRNYIDKFLTKKEINSKINRLKNFDLVFKYIDQNYSNKITNSDLANILNISTYHFCRTFKELSGKTSTEYINQIRLEKAIEYLSKENLNITEIALICGFENINYFSRLFKKQYKIAPTKFRKNHL